MTDLTNKIVDKITDEVIKAERKHANKDISIFKWLCILGEEVGEANQAAVKMEDEDGKIEHLKEELQQVAAVCIRILKTLED